MGEISVPDKSIFHYLLVIMSFKSKVTVIGTAFFSKHSIVTSVIHSPFRHGTYSAEASLYLRRAIDIIED